MSKLPINLADLLRQWKSQGQGSGALWKLAKAEVDLKKLDDSESR